MADLEQVASDLNSASQSLQELREKYNGALDLLDNKNTEITAVLESAKSNALQEVQTASNTATSQISQLKDTSLNAVNEAKNTATSEISSKKEEALGEFSQATSEFNSTKEEALSQIEQAKTEQGQKITALEQAKESITADLNKKSKLLTKSLNLTVGAGGDFTKISDALNEALKYSPAKIGAGNYLVKIILKDGFVINEQIKCIGINVGFVSIETETPDTEVIVENSAIQTEVGNLKTAFYASSNGVLPSLNFKCRLRTPNETNTTGFALRYGGRVVLTNKTEFSDFDNGCFIGENSNSTIQLASFKRNNRGIRCWKSFVDASGVNIDGSKVFSVENRGAVINLDTAKLINQKQGTNIINSTYSGITLAQGSDTSGSTVALSNITPNQITANGILMR